MSSGGDKPQAVDYTPMISATNHAADVSKQLGEAQLAESRRQYDNNMAIAAPVVDAQLGLMKSQREQGDALYKDYTDTYRPIATSLAKDAANFDTDAAKERFAGQAAADQESQQANQSAQNERSMASMGVNPNSGKFAALKTQESVLNAASRAGATSDARVKADDMSWSKRMQVGGMGTALLGSSLSANAGATNAGNAAVANNAQAGNALVAGNVASNATQMSGIQSGIQGLGSVLNSQTGIYGVQTQANAAANAATGSVIGAGLGAAASYYAKTNSGATTNNYYGNDY